MKSELLNAMGYYINFFIVSWLFRVIPDFFRKRKLRKYLDKNWGQMDYLKDEPYAKRWIRLAVGWNRATDDFVIGSYPLHIQKWFYQEITSRALR